MFDSLSQKLQNAFRNLRGLGKISEDNVGEALREVRSALLDADVNFQVARDFIEQVKTKSLGQEVVQSIQPGQQIIKIINDELVKLLGSANAGLTLSGNPSSILMVGLHGSGKTTSSAKLARLLHKQARTPLLVAADVYRPAAMEQLETLAKQIGLPVFVKKGETDVLKIARGALEFARARKKAGRPVEIINADSLLVYRGMNVGTAKPSPEELSEIPHHLIDICDPGENFTAGDFSRRVLKTLEDLDRQEKRAIIVGGSGFYLKALLYGLWEGSPADPALRKELEEIPSPTLYEQLHARDPESALRIGVNDRYRLVRATELLRLTGKTPTELQGEQNRTPDPRLRLLVVDRPSDELFARIHERTQAMIGAGLIDEVRNLREKFPGARALDAVGYEQTRQFLDGVTPPGRKSIFGEKGLIEEIELATRQLVKRQRTWFKSEKNSERFELARDRELLLRRLDEIYS